MRVRNLIATDDLLEVGEVYVSSWKDTYGDFVPSEYLETLTPKNWLQNVGDRRDFFVMFDEKKIIGMASIKGDETECAQIVSTYLLRDYLDQGHGRLLLNAMIKELEERGYEQAFLWVMKENSRARAFYKKNGFKLENEERNLCLGGKDFIEVKYTIELNSYLEFRSH